MSSNDLYFLLNEAIVPVARPAPVTTSETAKAVNLFLSDPAVSTPVHCVCIYFKILVVLSHDTTLPFAADVPPVMISSCTNVPGVGDAANVIALRALKVVAVATVVVP